MIADEMLPEYKKKIAQYGEDKIKLAERAIFLGVIDRMWIDHLNTMDSLRTSIGLRGYGQVDPLVVYKQEAYVMFERLLRDIDDEVINILLRVEMQPAGEPSAPPPIMLGAQTQGASEELAGGAVQVAPQGEGVMPGGEEENLPAVRSSNDEVGPAVSQPSEPVQSNSGVSVVVREPGQSSPTPISQPVTSSPASPAGSFPKVGRNDPCPCGSGKKYKKCHGR